MEDTPRQSYRLLYMVYSPRKDEYNEDFAEYLLSIPNLTTVWLVKEYGKDGDHPHLNFVFKSERRTDSLRRSMLQFLNKSPQDKSTKHLLLIKTVHDIARLATYITKEEKYEVLVEHPAYVLSDVVAKVPEEASSFYRATDEKAVLECHNEAEILSMLITYIEELAEPFEYSTFLSFQRHYVHSNFYCSRISWRKLYEYCSLKYDYNDDHYPKIYEI